jgi:hypothetical protein
MYKRAESHPIWTQARPALTAILLPLERASSHRTSSCSLLYLNSELLEPRYARPQKRIDALDDPIQIIIFLWRRRRKLHMQRAYQTARVLGPKLRVPVRRQSLDRSKLFRRVRKWRENQRRRRKDVTSARASEMVSPRSATSSASTLPVSMTSGITLAAISSAMKIEAIGSKPVQP